MQKNKAVQQLVKYNALTNICVPELVTLAVV